MQSAISIPSYDTVTVEKAGPLRSFSLKTVLLGRKQNADTLSCAHAENARSDL